MVTLVRLVYVSTAHDKVDVNEFRKILDTANFLNQKNGLTGMLAFNSRFFLQALEGSRTEINKLYTKLIADSRHHSVAILKFSEIAERRWAEWSMGYAAANTDNRALFLKYSPGNTFNPYLMTGDAAEKILIELTGTTLTVQKATIPEGAAIGAFSGSPANGSTGAMANSPPETMQPRAANGMFSRLFNRG
jgi:hypothetical protein